MQKFEYFWEVPKCACLVTEKILSLKDCEVVVNVLSVLSVVCSIRVFQPSSFMQPLSLPLVACDTYTANS